MKNRYFTQFFDDDLSEFDIEEISKKEFDSIEGLRERHTIFENGVNQICHTVIPLELY